MCKSLQGLALVCVGLLMGSLARAGEAYSLQENITTGHQHRVRTRVDLSGSLTPPTAKGKTPQVVKMDGTSAIDYVERVLDVDGRGQASKTLRICERLDFKRTLAGQPQELSLRAPVRRMVVLRRGHTEVPFSPDGPMTWGELDVVRTDVFIPGILGLLPGKAVEEGQRWQAADSAIEELTDLEKVEQGKIECRLDRIVVKSGHRLARVTFSGTIQGVGEDGTARHRLQGTYHFDLTENYLADVTLLGTASLLDKDEKEVGRIEGRFVMSREVGRFAGLDDSVVRSLKSEPDGENTMMLFDSPELGVRFRYYRRWRMAQVMGSQVAFATADGSGILLTVEPTSQVPTARGFQEESRAGLDKQKAKVTRIYSPRRLREKPVLDAFALEAEVKDQKVWMDYYITQQAGGGATLAARLIPGGELNALRKEVDRMATSITITKRIPEPGPAKKK